MSPMPEPELIRLPNGVRLALDPMPGLCTCALGVWVRVGARWERAAENGVAHLFEHMAFKGAGGRDAKAFAEAIETLGASMNAATGYERTAYYARTLKEHAPAVFDLVADVLLAPHWEPAELEKEKFVVLQEIGEAFDQPDDRVFEAAQAKVFPDQPLGRAILGTAETLATITVETLEAFRAAHQTADRIVISAAGAFDRDRLLARIEARFGDAPSGRGLAAEPARPGGGAVGEARRLEQLHLAASWPAPRAGDPRTFSARVLSEIFGGGMSSRLFQEVREARGLVYAIDSYLDGYEDAGRLGVYAGCAAKDARAVAGLTLDCLADLAQRGPTAAELARAQTTLAAQLLMGAEAPTARAEARAAQVFLRDRLVPFEELRQGLAATTAESVQAEAQRALEGRAAAAALGPKAGLGAAAALAAD